MTENDIKGNLAAIRELASQAAGAELPEGERQMIKMLCDSGLLLLEGLLVDINRSADALESISNNISLITQHMRGGR
jgi:hypothetical protein